MGGTVDWVPGLVVLAAGLLGGFFLVRRLKRSAPAAAPGRAPAAVRDLEARRDALVDQLRELEDAAGTRDERTRLEREAALVLRDLDRVTATAAVRAAPAGGASAAPAAATAAPQRAALKGFLWGTGSAAALAVLIFLVSRSASERGEGGSLTGEVPGAAGGAGAPGLDAEMSELQAAVERNPEDLEARLTLARTALARQDMMVVYEQTRAVLEKQPGHPRALSYQALVRLAMGQADTAEKMLREALATEPDLLEGYIHLSLVHLRQGRADAAEADIEEAARRSPEHAPRLRALWAEMRAQTEPAPEGASPPGEDPHAGLPEPGARPAAAPADGVRGTVELASGVRPAPGAVVFVSVRPAGTAGGPPLAAKRLAATSFPLAFEVGPGDSMMGQALPDRVRLDVRVDGDGDPMTRDPADPSASADDVRLGAAGVRLVVKKGP